MIQQRGITRLNASRYMSEIAEIVEEVMGRHKWISLQHLFCRPSQRLWLFVFHDLDAGNLGDMPSGGFDQLVSM